MEYISASEENHRQNAEAAPCLSRQGQCGSATERSWPSATDITRTLPTWAGQKINRWHCTVVCFIVTMSRQHCGEVRKVSVTTTAISFLQSLSPPPPTTHPKPRNTKEETWRPRYMYAKHMISWSPKMFGFEYFFEKCYGTNNIRPQINIIKRRYNVLLLA